MNENVRTSVNRSSTVALLYHPAIIMALSTTIHIFLFVILIWCQCVDSSVSEDCPVEDGTKCTCWETDDRNLHVDCFLKQLHRVPKNLPSRTEYLDLGENYIQSIQDKDFQGLQILRYLDLSTNNISFIAREAFWNLTVLEVLDLGDNFLYRQPDFLSSDHLKDLVSLSRFVFTIAGYNLPSNISHYSTSSLCQLSALRDLTIDMIAMPLAPQTRHLHNLYHLTVNTVHNHTFSFDGGFFDNVEQVKNLTVGPVIRLKTVNQTAFLGFFNITEIHIYGPNELVGYQIFNKLYSATIRASGLKTLRLKTLTAKTDDTGSLIFYLENSDRCLNCSVETMDFGGNQMFGIRFYTFLLLPPSLTTLILSKNCLLLYKLVVYSGLHKMKKIKVLDARDQNEAGCGMSFRSFRSENFLSNTDSNSVNNISLESFAYTHFSIYFFRQRFKSVRFPSLRLLSFKGSNFYTDNALPDKFSQHFPRLEHLDLSYCKLNTLQRGSMEVFTHLRYMNLRFNNIGDFPGDLFQNIHSLEYLDLSHNRMASIHRHTCATNRNLRVLNISYNDLEIFNLNLNGMRHLKMLDLSFNRLKWFSKHTVNQLQERFEDSALTLNLTGNTLLCSCDSLFFLRWLNSTNVRLEGEHHLKCAFSNGTVTFLNPLDLLIVALEKECRSYMTLIIISSLLILGIFGGIVGGIAYRYRWDLKYMYHVVKMKFRRSSIAEEYERIYDYDAFISYAEDDNGFVRNELLQNLEKNFNFKLCLHERDFQPGESIAYNISTAIHTSRRTVLIITKHFLASHWCLYELNISRIESFHRQSRFTLLILLEDIPTDQLPIDVLDMVRSQTYLEYPRGNDSAMDLFWSKCSDFISTK